MLVSGPLERPVKKLCFSLEAFARLYRFKVQPKRVDWLSGAMPMTQDEKIVLLRYAIENSKQVSAVVRELPRVFCPHILGTMNLRCSVVAWQFEGLSTAGDLPNWRRFELDDITSMELVDGPWHQGFRRLRGPRKFDFDRVDAIADPGHLGYLRVVSLKA
jgi:hypothetical protein